MAPSPSTSRLPNRGIFCAMVKNSLSPEVTVWSDAQHAAGVGALMDLMGSSVKPIGVGGTRNTQVNELAKQLGCDKQDDLRKLLVDHPASFLLLTTLKDVSADDLGMAIGQGTTVLTFEPIASDLQELAGSQKLGGVNVTETAGRIVHVPAFAQSPGFLSAADPYEVLGDRRLISLSTRGRPEHGSLYARLYDAWLTVLSFTDLPESIDASLVGPLLQPPQRLRDLTGGLAAHARMPGDSAALLEASDTAGLTDRSVRVQASSGTLGITDTAYTLRDPQGQLLDETAAPPGPGGFVDMLATQWRRMLDRPNLTGTGPHAQQVADAVACCLACLLSIRTGQPESPHKLLEMNR